MGTGPAGGLPQPLVGGFEGCVRGCLGLKILSYRTTGGVSVFLSELAKVGVFKPSLISLSALATAPLKLISPGLPVVEHLFKPYRCHARGSEKSDNQPQGYTAFQWQS